MHCRPSLYGATIQADSARHFLTRAALICVYPSRRGRCTDPVRSVFAAHLVSRRDPETFARPLFSTHASCLLSALLLYEVSAKVLTIARAVEGSLLLAGCTAKLFFTIWRPGDPYRIASFIVLGLLLMGGSWVYTRHRKQIEGVL